MLKLQWEEGIQMLSVTTSINKYTGRRVIISAECQWWCKIWEYEILVSSDRKQLKTISVM